MSQVYLFPGQGSQFKGMGSGLFKKYPELVRQADELLGYSIERLCVSDPENVLARTDYTQPALYVVNALTYFQAMEKFPEPECFAGHSLGEFNALLAAGAYDFITGLDIVKQRGILMAQAAGGAMAAVLGLELKEVERILEANEFAAIDVANINSKKQIILSGLSGDLVSCSKFFESAGAKFIALNVSAAFHSRYMKGVQNEFSKYLDEANFRPLEKKVISNVSTDYYPSENYLEYIKNQLVSPVRWYQGISRLLKSGYSEFEELGPGLVLTRLVHEIKKEPANVDVFNFDNARLKNRILNVFMYSDRSEFHEAVGLDLYDRNTSFKNGFDHCSQIVESKTGTSLVDKLHAVDWNLNEFSEVLYVQLANYSFGFSLTRFLIDQGIEVDGVLGYGLGEYLAATVAGSIRVEDAVELIIAQSGLNSKGANYATLSVVESANHYYDNPTIYKNTELIAVNCNAHFELRGAIDVLSKVQKQIDKLEIPNLMKKQKYLIKADVNISNAHTLTGAISNLTLNKPGMPVFSAACAASIVDYNPEYFVDVATKSKNFLELMKNIREVDKYCFIDCSSTGSLSNFIKYCGVEAGHHAVVNPAVRSLDAVRKVVAEISRLNH